MRTSRGGLLAAVRRISGGSSSRTGWPGAALLLGVFVLSTQPALGQQDYPTRPIKFVVGSQSGGVTDIRARRFGLRLGELLKQPIVVENRPGASATIAADFVAKSVPDGYTILFGGNTELVVAPALAMPIKFDPIKDFAPVAQATLGSPLLVVNAHMGPKTVAELVQWAKARPGQLMCGTSGHGSGAHFICELLARTAGIELRHVAYKGSAPMLLDMAAGQIHLGLGYLAEVERQFIVPGKVTPIAALAPQRLERYPQVPTMADLGMSGFEIRAWTGLFMPAGSPQEAVNRVNLEMAKIVREPEFTTWLKETGSDVVNPSPEQFRAFVQSELTRWKKMSDDLGIRAEGQ